MTVALTPFQQTVMSDVIRQHESATVHTAYCCETVERYRAQLADCTPRQATPPARRSVSGKPASEKQINFIKVLLDKKVATPFEREGMDLEGMTSAEASKFIETLLKREDDIEAPVRRTEKINRPASEKQTAYIENLASKREWASEGAYADIINAVLKGEEIGSKEASLAIDHLLACPKAERPEVGEEGYYFYEGEYYKVLRAVHGSGRLYSKKFDRETESWNRGGSLGKLTAEHKLTAEQASQFGHLYGRCVSCHLPLTDDHSKDMGYGEKCAENNGWPY